MGYGSWELFDRIFYLFKINSLVEIGEKYVAIILSFYVQKKIFISQNRGPTTKAYSSIIVIFF